MLFSSRSPRCSDRRGAMLPLIAVLLPVLLIFLGFAVDLAYMQTTRLELQAAADVAARAGATKLSQTDSDSAAREAARNISKDNHVAGKPLLLRVSDVQVGRSTRNGAGKWVFTAGGSPANAVRVTAPRNLASRGGPVPLFFGSLIGTPSFQPMQNATASFLNVDVCLVLDRSSSMKLGVTEGEKGMSMSDPRCCVAPNADSRWTALDGAVRLFITELGKSDSEEYVALATYSSNLGGSGFCGASSQPSSLDCGLGADLSKVDTAMNRLKTTVWNGNTYIESGMRTGLLALQDNTLGRKAAEKVMIVMTDGHQNQGNALLAAQACAAAGVTVHAITFSSGADRELMQDVANIGGGQSYHADDAAGLKKIFKELADQTAQLTE